MLFVCANGARLAALGFGTWLIKGRVAREGVAHALELGHWHVDTAHAYENEREVGEGIREAGVPREEGRGQTHGRRTARR